MPDTVEHLILENVKATLETITIANGYFQTLGPGRVYVFQGNALDQVQTPSVTLYHRGTEKSTRVNFLQTCMLEVVAHCVIQAAPSANWRRDIERLCSDVEKALRADYTRGALAVDTRIVSSAIASSGDGANLAEGQVIAQVHFRHLYDDPNVAA